MHALSPEAQNLCANWFPFGEASVVRSHDPDGAVQSHLALLNELVEAGLVVSRSHYDLGFVEYVGSAETRLIAQNGLQSWMTENFGDSG